MNEFHRVNLMEALAGMESQPAQRVSLDAYRRSSMHGKQYCIAGVLTSLPHFQAQGVFPDPRHGGPIMANDGAGVMEVAQTLDHLFGPFARDGQALFAKYGHGAWDLELFEGCAQLPTHKELALLRLRHVLKLVVADVRRGGHGAAIAASTPKRAQPIAA